MFILAIPYQTDLFSGVDLTCASEFCLDQIYACGNSSTCFAMLEYNTLDNVTGRIPIFKHSNSGSSEYDAFLKCARIGAGTTTHADWGSHYEEWCTWSPVSRTTKEMEHVTPHYNCSALTTCTLLLRQDDTQWISMYGWQSAVHWFVFMFIVTAICFTGFYLSYRSVLAPFFFA